MPPTGHAHTVLLLPKVTDVEELRVPHQSPRGTQAEGSTQVEQLQQLNLQDGQLVGGAAEHGRQQQLTCSCRSHNELSCTISGVCITRTDTHTASTAAHPPLPHPSPPFPFPPLPLPLPLPSPPLTL